MMQQLAFRAYHAMGFQVFDRIDTILSEERLFLLEGNTFTRLMYIRKEKPHSHIGLMARVEGKDGKDLQEEIIRALSRDSV
jgi:D-alanine-D-alanine ligase-like ATP-grasp enzyme